jgi:hypothetical protein
MMATELQARRFCSMSRLPSAKSFQVAFAPVFNRVSATLFQVIFKKAARTPFSSARQYAIHIYDA